MKLLIIPVVLALVFAWMCIVTLLVQWALGLFDVDLSFWQSFGLAFVINLLFGGGARSQQ